MQNPAVSRSNNPGPRQELVARLKACPPNAAATQLMRADVPLAFEALAELNPSFTQDILSALPEERRQVIIAAATTRSIRCATIRGGCWTVARAGFDPDNLNQRAKQRGRARAR